MEDKKIVDMFFSRDEQAIEQVQKKYGAYLYAVANNILASESDSEECINDAYHKAWQTIPPARPEYLGAYLAKAVRNCALSKRKADSAQKRSANVDAVFLEAVELIPDSLDIADEVAVRDTVNAFLSSLPKRTRMIFMRRYWFYDSIEMISDRFELTRNNVKVILKRTRDRFKTFLEREGISV